MSEEQQAPGRQGESVVLPLRNPEDVALMPIAAGHVQFLEIPIPGLPIFTPVSESTQPFQGENLVVKRKCLDFGQHEVNQYGVSDIEEESFGFLWQLKNYSALAENREILSPIFTGGPKSKYRWQLRISPKNMSQGQEFFGISLGLAKFGDDGELEGRKIKGKFQIKILDTDWNPGVVANQPKWVEFNNTNEWGYRKVMPTATLSSPSRRLLENDSLKIQCSIRLLRNAKEKVYSGGAAVRCLAEEEKTIVKNDALAFDMGMALRNSVFTDIEIEAADEVFKAHKAILTARSPVFANLLNTPSLGGEIAKILVHEFDGEVVQTLLDYIYTAEVEEEVVKRRAVDLLQAAEKYDLDGLKEDCEYAIGETMTLENAADILVMSDLFQANLLKGIAMEFIDRNKEKVYKTPSFQLVAKTRPELLGEVYLSTLVGVEGPLIITIDATSTDKPMEMDPSTT